MKNILKLTKYLKTEKKPIAIVGFFSLAMGLVTAILPLQFKRIVDNVADATKTPGSDTTEKVALSVLLLGSLLLGNVILEYFNERYSDTIRMRILTILRQRIYPKVIDLSVDYIERHQPGAVIQRVTQGIGDFQMWVFSVAEWLFSLLTSTVFILIIIWIKSPWMGLLFTIALPIMVWLNFRKVREAKEPKTEANKQYEKFAGTFSESIAQLTTIKTMSAERQSRTKIDNLTNRILGTRLKQFRIERNHNVARDLIGNITVTLSVVMAAYFALEGKFTTGDLFLIVFYSRDLVSSINPISRFIQNTSDVEVTSERLVSFLETKPSLTDKPDALPLTALETIEFKNVSFSYPDGKKGAIRNISFKIEGGKTVALVGPSGTGKSTITKLLLRFYEPSDGQILINGKDVSTFTQESIRQHIGMVMQDVALFNTTIDENLGMANARADKAMVVQAAKQAHADEFIQDLPKKYKTLVGERGIKLSGGQKQRVAIARAILKNPQLIILDEATSALDSESERLVQDGLKKLMAGRSALVIAHRLSTIMHADEILVLKNGKVAERGTHSELINQTGLYKKLFNLQSSSGKVKL
jgi:ABC-type multidrug transport system fused ATPase/permease subunit